MRRHVEGVTLIEACAVLAVLAVLLATATPSLQRSIERQALRGAADELRSDLQFLRAAAVSRGEVVWLGVRSGPGGSCYVVYAGGHGDCNCTVDGQPACAAGSQALKTVGFDDRSGLQLQSTAALLGIEPVRGTATPTATLKLASRSGDAVQELVNVMGRVRACSPAAAVPGYKAC